MKTQVSSSYFCYRFHVAEKSWWKNSNTCCAHLPSTYTALLTLALLRAPLDKLDIPNLISFLRSCQAPDGSYVPESQIYATS